MVGGFIPVRRNRHATTTGAVTLGFPFDYADNAGDLT